MKMKFEFSILCVGFLILLSNCNAQNSCITWSNKYGFCQKSLHSNNCTGQHPECEENETCYAFERSLNTKGSDILKKVWKKCGELNVDRIAGGIDAQLFELPWLVLLIGAGETCAGTLITNRWVLTAAHCIKPTLNAVKLGEYNLLSDPDCPHISRVRINQCAETKIIDVETFETHPDYNLAFMKRDIALIKLKKPVNFNKSIAPVCLPIYQHHTERLAGAELAIAGWGLTENGYQSAILQKAKVKLIETDACADHYKRTGINRSHICAQGLPDVGTCPGDSGGPLVQVYNNKEIRSPKKYIQIGVTSRGAIKCGSHPFPYPYTSVVDVMPWITSIIDS